MPKIRSLLLVTVVASAACTVPGADTSSITIADSAGVAIVDNGPIPSALPELPAFPTLTIGVVDGPPEYQFYRISDAKRLSDGAIAVTNSGARELKIFEPDGTHRATAGGPGGGPAEFGYPTYMAVLPGDTIQVQDRLDRVYFTADGEFVRRLTGDRESLAKAAHAVGGYSEGGGWLADGSFFAPVYERDGSKPTPGPPFRPGMTLVRMSSNFASIDTLGQFGGVLQQYIDVGGRQGVSSFVPPFAPNTGWALGAADGTIAVADNVFCQVYRFHSNGTRSIVRWSSNRDPVTATEVEEWKAQQRDASWTQGQLPELERAWAAMTIPETRPCYGNVMMGSDGSVWLTAGGPLDDTLVLEFSQGGRFVQRLLFPRQFRVLDSDDKTILGVARDDNEVEYLELYPR